MDRLIPAAKLIATLLILTSIPQSQNTSCSVSGRVTIEGKPAAGVAVMLEAEWHKPVSKLLQGQTDAEGRFRISGAPPGTYTLRVHAYAHVMAASDRHLPGGKRMVLAAGDSVDGIEFDLTPGAVVTGRVVDENGQPVVGVYVGVLKPRRKGDHHNEGVELHYLPGRNETDDRGVYRLFGLPAGKFLIGVTIFTAAQDDTANYVTYYPGVADQEKAMAIELATGEEKTGLDITIPPPVKTYKVSGRLVDAVSGKGVPGVYVDCEPLDDNDWEKTRTVEMSPEVRTTDAEGNFRIIGLQPGQYRLATTSWSHMQLEWYVEEQTFEITDGNLSGIELKARRGGSISGVIVIEGSNDPQALASRANLQVHLSTRQEGRNQSGQANSGYSNSQGRFRVAGLRAGEYGLQVFQQSANRNLYFERIEVAGRSVNNMIELREGQHLTDLRIVMTYGSSVVRGRVSFQNGEPPKGVCFLVATGRQGHVYSLQATVSASSQYVLEGLAPGSYDLRLVAFPCGATESPKLPSPTQTVTVTNGAEVRADFVLDLASKP